jgi:DNA repair protein RadC
MTGGIKEWPEDERPREKMLKQGAENLTNAELLALIIRT